MKKTIVIIIALAMLLGTLISCDNSKAQKQCEHQYEVVETIPSSCTNPGTIVNRCSICGDIYHNTIVSLEHKWVTVSNSKNEATCTEDGEKTDKCSVCGTTRTTKQKAFGHHFVEQGCEQYSKCDRCGQLSSEIAEHSWNKEGYCTKCGKDSYDTITVNGVIFQIPSTPFMCESRYDYFGRAYITDITISFEATYGSYSKFYVIYSAEKSGGKSGEKLSFSYTLYDKEGYTISSAVEYSSSNVAPGGKIKEEHFSFNLPHVSGDLKKGETYRLVIQ